MARWAHTTWLLAPALVAACAGNPDRQTLAKLHSVEPDVSEVKVENSLDQAMSGYRKFLEEAPESALTPEAMRRLADLKLEKEYGILGDGKIQELPAPEAAAAEEKPAAPKRAATSAGHAESDKDFERRTTRAGAALGSGAKADLLLPNGKQAEAEGPLQAIALYDQILTTYPNYPQNDQVLYQKARAFDELARTEDAIAVIEQLIAQYPGSRHIDEVQFRRAEYFFVRKRFLDAEKAYSAITAKGPRSEYYELALYKLGWTLYKQDLLEEALHEYVALLDFKVSTGYDFDKKNDEDTERRIADTYRVISLAFSSLGGPPSVVQYFSANGHKSYEDRIYRHLGEFYLEKLRYQDAAASYQAFIDLNPLHKASPHFSIRVIEIYEKGDFPKLVLDSKKAFAATYGLQSEYWRHFDIGEAPEIRSYLKSNLEDLARHYHAQFQSTDLAAEKPAHFAEAERWYRAYLSSFPSEPESPAIDYRLADLLLENKNFGLAAREYERTAYDYPEHEKAAAAGYAAIYAHREHEKVAKGEEQQAVQRAAVESTLRFVGKFPKHEHAGAVLGAAVDDLYEMKEFDRAIATGQQLIDGYPQADPAIRRSAWTVVAHASFETAAYPQAESAYTRVLEMTPAEDASRKGLIDNLAASIYKQGELANAAQDHRAAADHFLRVAKAAPTSTIRPSAEYDAGAALMRLKDWGAAASVLDAFRKAYPEHELNREATKQIAFVKREEGNLSGAAAEFERVAAESDNAELSREALLEAGDLYEKSKADDRALAAYLAYVKQFPEPVEPALETRWKIAGKYAARHDDAAHREQLRQIVAADAAAGGQRSPRTRYLAAQSALVLAQDLYREFAAVKLRLPFERSLQEKQKRMNATLEAFGALVDYEVGDVTAAATFYMAEIYSDFSQSLLDSERPGDLSPAELAEYQSTLEDEAFPFEEKAIAVHEKNLELLGSGVYNTWIDKSLSRLAELSPGRYAKFEASSGWIGSIDSYAYRAPALPAQPAPAAEPQAPVQPAAIPVEPVGPPVEPAAVPAEPAAEPAAPAPAAPAPAAPAPDMSGEPMAER
jgi:outer membrane protein assembly factor BamD (BamD/ComL family)